MAMHVNHHPQDAAYLADHLQAIPTAYQHQVKTGYSRMYQQQGRQAANLHLLNLANHAQGSGFTFDDNALKLKAERLALQCRQLIKLAGADDQAVKSGLAFFQSAGFDPQDLDTYDTAGITGRLADPDFWRRKLIRRQDRQQEAFAIRAGLVGRKRGLYVSDVMFQTIQGRIASSIKALSALEAVNEENGETVAMLQILQGSVANPEIRRVELMVRMRGFEEAATQAGHIGMFYTITCPSKYHRYRLIRNADGKVIRAEDNPKYNGATPREAQAYLTGLWARIRSKLKRDNLTAYGFRVAEPHHDGCPHWHLLLFTPPHQQKTVTQVLRSYAMQEDGNEKGADKYRFKAEKIDTSKGSATGYIAKYVSKNINGYGVDEDYESGLDAADSAQRVRAWASLWGIRQFQQIGGAPVGVWRELRRLDTAPDGLLEQARKAADAGDWCQYLQLQGGVSSLRKDQPLKVYTVERIDTETGEVISNKYGEITGKVEGVSLLSTSQVKTRLHVWRIQQKAGKPADLVADVAYVGGFSILSSAPVPQSDICFSSSGQRDSAAPWSTVNNCTPAPSYEELERIAIQMEGWKTQEVQQ